MTDHFPRQHERRRPLRILMVAPTSFFADYGCHVRILEEVRALQSRGHRVRVCTYHNGGTVPSIDIKRSVDVPWLKRSEVGSSRHKAYLDIALCFETLRQALHFRPDVIHAHLHEGALIGALIGALLRKPVVFDYQGSLTEEMLDHRFIRKGGLRERFFRRLEQFIDGLPIAIVPSGVAAERYLLNRGQAPARIMLIADSVDTSRLDPQHVLNGRSLVRARLGIPHDAPVVMYLGLLATYQGTDLLIDATRRLLARRPDMYVVIAGYPGADRYALAARDMPHVLFPGRVPYDDVPSLLAAADVAVAPKLSRTEGNGKLLNYMAMELPVVAFDTPTNRAILGGLGHLVPPGDVDALAGAVEVALNDDRQSRRALRERVVRLFSWEKQVLNLEAVYARALRHAARFADAPVAERATLGDD
jgi:glycosyltransferase involved in cell wall biosynthesis